MKKTNMESLADFIGAWIIMIIIGCIIGYARMSNPYIL